jgi:predicted Zn-dependent peptidase
MRAWAVAAFFGVILGTTRVEAEPRIAHRDRTLDNGLRVILHQDDRLPIVAVEVHYQLGTMHDPASARGQVHTIEHMMFRGSLHVPDGDHFFHLQRAGGVGTNASTRSEDMSFVETVPSLGLATALWLESDRMGFFAPHREALDSERLTVANEWQTRVSSEPRTILMEQVWNALFDPTHPYHHESADSVRAVTFDGLQATAQRHIGPGNAVLVLAGALPADIDDMVDHYFADLAGAAPPADVDVTRRLPRDVRLAPATGLSRTPMALLAWPTPGLHAPGDAEADILATALNNEVFETIARREGIDTDGLVVFEAQQVSMVGQSAMFMVATGPPGQDPADLERAIDRVLHAVVADGLQPDDIRRAGKRLSTDLLSVLQTLEGRAALLSTYAATGHDPDWIAQDVARYDRIDSTAVQGFVQAHLLSSGRVVLLNRGTR